MTTRTSLLAAALFSCGLASQVQANSSNYATQAELRINNTGLVRVSHEDLLAQGINWSGVSASTLRLSQGAGALALRYEGPATFGPGSAVYFFGQAVTDSDYTKTALYRLTVGGTGSQTVSGAANGRGSCKKNGDTRDVLIHNPNRGYDLTSAHSSPWYAQRVVRSNVALAGADEGFTIVGKVAGASGDRIEVGMWGGINYAAAPDHSVRLLLNGTVIATQQFDGLAYQQISATLPPDVLRNGANTLRMELVGDTGLAVDVVYLDNIRVEYTRSLNAVNNRVAFTNAAAPAANDSTSCHGQSECSKYLISGLTSANVNVFRGRQDGSVEAINDVIVKSDGGGYEACFSVPDTSGDRYWIEPATGSVFAEISPKSAVVDPLSGAAANYLVISHGNFIDNLGPLVAARSQEGYSVRVVNVSDIYDYYNKGTVDPDAIGTAIADAYQRLGTRYVLLVGGDTYDYFNDLGGNSRSFLPTYYLPNGTAVRFAPTDAPYADIDADGMSDLAIGRFPVRTTAELDALISKTLAYAQGNHAGKLLKVSDRTDSVPYADLLSGIDRVLGAGSLATNLSLNNYANNGAGVAQARSDLAAVVNSGYSLLAYFGHALPGSWSTAGLVTSPQVSSGLFSNASSPTVVWVMGCYGAYFTSPSGDDLAPALMLQPNGGGAAAVFGSSSLSDVNSQLFWMIALKQHLSHQTVGESMRLAQRYLREAGPQYADIATSGVLLGDPALQVR